VETGPVSTSHSGAGENHFAQERDEDHCAMAAHGIAEQACIMTKTKGQIEAEISEAIKFEL